MFFWMYGIAAWLSRIPHVPDAFTTLLVLGLGAVASSIYLCLRLIALHPGFKSLHRRMELAALLCFVLIFRTSPLYFLDREHVFFVLTLPYVLRFMPSLARAPVPLGVRLFIAVAAGAGFCIKPYCLAAWAGVQLLYMIEQKSGRILYSLENCVILCHRRALPSGDLAALSGLSVHRGADGPGYLLRQPRCHPGSSIIAPIRFPSWLRRS